MIKVFTKNNCPKCEMTKMILNQEGIEFEAINIEVDLSEEEKEKKLQEFRDKGFMSMPVVKSDGVEFSDFQPEKLKELK